MNNKLMSLMAAVGGLVAWKTALMLLAIVGLLAANVATLVSHTAFDALYHGLRAVVGVAGGTAADRLTRNSMKAQTARSAQAATKQLTTANQSLHMRNSQLTQQVGTLTAQNSKLQFEHEALQTRRVADAKKVKEVAGVVKARLAKGVVRNQVSIPAEAIPYLGIGVILGVSALDIYDACETMKDFNTVLLTLGEGEEAPDFCGAKLPTKEAIVEAVRKNWRESVDRAKVELQDAPAAVKQNVQQMSVPTVRQAMDLLCPVMPSACMKQ
jgi:uncharacterized membrane-anchored protein YhcB (DUF1043 family)